MNEKYVCSVELVKKLEELGVRRESEFYWAHTKRFEMVKGKCKIVDKGMQLTRAQKFIDTEHYHAYLTDELLEMISKGLNKDFNLELGASNMKFVWWLRSLFFTYHLEGRIVGGKFMYDDIIPNSLGKLLILGIEEKIISVEEINKEPSHD